MSTITVNEIEHDAAKVFRRVEAGELFVVTMGGRVVAELRPIPMKPSEFQKRPHGLAAGQFTVPDDFDAPLPDNIIESFEAK